jgi:hypothetical protein
VPETISAATDLDLISYFKAITDPRMRRGVRIPSWYLLLVAVLGILSRCQSLRDLERFAERHHGVLSEALGIELRRYPSDSAFRYFFQQVDVAALCTPIRDWTLAQIPGGATDLDQLVCVALGFPRSGWQDAARLARAHARRLFRVWPPADCVYISQVMLYSAALGVAISQACYATGENHERAVLRQLLGELELEGVLIQADALHTQRPFFNSSRSRGPTSC